MLWVTNVLKIPLILPAFVTRPTFFSLSVVSLFSMIIKCGLDLLGYFQSSHIPRLSEVSASFYRDSCSTKRTAGFEPTAPYTGICPISSAINEDFEAILLNRITRRLILDDYEAL